MTGDAGFSVYLMGPDGASRRVAVASDLAEAAARALDLADRLGQRPVWLDHGSPTAVEVHSHAKLELSIQIIPGGLIRRRDTKSRSR